MVIKHSANWISAFWLALFLIASTCWPVNGQTDESYPPTERTEQGTTWEVTGKVVNSSNVPVPGTTVQAIGQVEFSPMHGRRGSLLSTATKTGLHGDYRISVRSNKVLVANAPTYAPTAESVSERSLVELELQPGREIKGQLFFPSGRPASEVTVTPVLFEFHGDNERRQLPFPDMGERWAVITDDDGKFSVSAVPSKNRVALHVEHPGYLGELIWVDPDQPKMPEPTGVATVDDNFEYTLRRAQLLKLIGRDKDHGSPVKISKVKVSKRATNWPIEYDSHWRTLKPSSVVELSFSDLSKSWTFWVVPEDERYLGVRVNFSGNPKESDELTVEFKKGVPIEGVVVDQRNQVPIPDVGILWGNSPQGVVSPEGYFADTMASTNQNGRFRLFVPESPGEIVVIGGVSGYQCLGTYQVYLMSTKERVARFIRPIENGRPIDGSEQPIKFELLPDYEVIVRTILADGTPVPFAAITARVNNFVPGKRENLFMGGVGRTSTTDGRGHTTLKGWYNCGIYLDLARENHTRPPAENNPRIFNPFVDARANHYPTTIQAFSDDGNLQGSVVVPIPEEGDFSPIEVSIEMQPTAKLRGRIVDENGEPIGDLDVQVVPSEGMYAGFINHGFQKWKTKTRSDGVFLLQGVSPMTDFKLTVADDVLMENTFGHADPNIEGKNNLLPGTTFEIPTLKCRDLRWLEQPLPEIDFAGGDPSEIVNEINRYIEARLAALPQVDSQFSSNRFDGPREKYLDRLSEKVISRVEDLAKIPPGSGEELEILKSMHKISLARPNRYSISDNNSDFTFDRLLEHQNKNPDAQQLLLALARNTDQRMEALFEKAQDRNTRSVAGQAIVLAKFHNAMNVAVTGMPGSNFEQMTGALQSSCDKLVDLYRTDSEPEGWQKLRTELTESIKDAPGYLRENQNKKLPESWAPSQEKMEQVVKIIEQFLKQTEPRNLD